MLSLPQTWRISSEFVTRSAGARIAVPRAGLVRSTVSAGTRVVCQSGLVWITADGGSEDILLEAGAARSFPRRARVLAEGLEDSVIFLRR